MNVRKANAADAPSILQLYALPHVTPFMRKPTVGGIERAIASVESLSVVVESGATIAGYALLKNVAANWGIAEFSQLLVREPRRGYGRALLQWAVSHLFSERHAHRLYLEVVAHNRNARKLYEACGFVLEGIFRDGFPADDGSYHDLAAYGMLETEYRGARPLL